MPTERRRRPFARLTTAALTGLGATFLWTFWLDHQLYGTPVWPVLVLGLTALVVAGLVATRRRWPLPVAAIVGGLVLFTAFREPFVIMRLTAPETAWTFLATVLIVSLSALSAVAGLLGTVRGRRTPNLP